MLTTRIHDDNIHNPFQVLFRIREFPESNLPTPCMMQNSDFSWLLPFDKTKKLNLERIVLSFKKHEDDPVSSITVLFSNESNGLV